MKQPVLSNTFTDTFDVDFKAEVIAAELISNAVSADQIMIVPLGSRQRSFRKDVDAVTEQISEYNNKEYTLITTHKEGIYDMLPEGLFHLPALPKSVTTEQEFNDILKQRVKEEANARRFFLPFEAGINDLGIQMTLFESRLDKGAHHNDLVNIFKGHWGIFEFLNSEQANIFLQVLPLIHDIRDDYTAAATIFELIFLVPVTITSQRERPVKSANPIFSTLNDTRLGIDFTTGNIFFDGGEDDILVTIGPMDSKQLAQFMPGTANSKILELLSDYLLPVHLEIITLFELYASDKITRLAEKEKDHNSTLGLSTYL